MSEWMPIESAPKDGTEFLAALNYGAGWEYAVMMWCEDGLDWINNEGCFIGYPKLFKLIEEPKASPEETQ